MEAQTTTSYPSRDQTLQREEEEEDGEGEEIKQHPSMPPTPQDFEKGTNKTPELQTAVEKESYYVTGFHLVVLMGCLTLVTFLILLDVSIIATVRLAIKIYLLHKKTLSMADNVCLSLGHPPYHERLPLSPRCRMVWCSVSTCEVRTSMLTFRSRC
jgi:hypothetical protein